MSEPQAKDAPTNKLPRQRGWNRFIFANNATRREAKAILFQELAATARNGMPLDEALEYSMRTAGEAGNADASTRGRTLQSLTALVYLLMATVGAFFLLMFSSAWAADVERIARLLALRLLPLVRAGHSLSDAMAAFPRDYSKEEIEIVRSGESWNRVPEALDSLGKFQYYERELQRHWERMAYPLVLLGAASMIVIFCIVFIVPKFDDIYMQLGVELPASTQWLVNVSQPWMLTTLAVAAVIALPLILFYLLRLFMVGNRVLRDMLGGAIILGSIFLAFQLFGYLSSQNHLSFGVFGWIIVFIVIAVAAVFLATLVFYGTERVVRATERMIARLFGSIPVLGAPRVTERESRWLAALSLGLSSGQGAPEALAAAGRITGGEMGLRSERAADLVGKGYSIGHAVVDAKVLRKTWANRLRLLDGRPAYTEGLEDIADDAARQSYHALNRSSRLAEVLSVCLLGLGAGLFAYAMYMPLFTIPLIIGTEY